jgi:hypothetical protein
MNLIALYRCLMVLLLMKLTSGDCICGFCLVFGSLAS